MANGRSLVATGVAPRALLKVGNASVVNLGTFVAFTVSLDLGYPRRPAQRLSGSLHSHALLRLGGVLLRVH